MKKKYGAKEDTVQKHFSFIYSRCGYSQVSEYLEVYIEGSKNQQIDGNFIFSNAFLENEKIEEYPYNFVLSISSRDCSLADFTNSQKICTNEGQISYTLKSIVLNLLGTHAIAFIYK